MILDWRGREIRRVRAFGLTPAADVWTTDGTLLEDRETYDVAPDTDQEEPLITCSPQT